MSEYSATPSTGKLKLKGVKDSRIEKKKKKTKAKADDGGDSATPESFTDRSVVLKNLEDEDAKIREDYPHRTGTKHGAKPNAEFKVTFGSDPEGVRQHLKTDAEKRYDEQRRKRLEERLKREGVKTHKERVEELNRYLSTLSEHHDMPKIGPG